MKMLEMCCPDRDWQQLGKLFLRLPMNSTLSCSDQQVY